MDGTGKFKTQGGNRQVRKKIQKNKKRTRRKEWRKEKEEFFNSF
jgi:hypothetical protein